MQDSSTANTNGVEIKQEKECLNGIPEVILWIRQHQKFLETSFSGELGIWAESKLLPEQRERLKTFSEELQKVLNDRDTRDIRKLDIFPDATACFVDCVTGIESSPVGKHFPKKPGLLDEERKIRVKRNKHIDVKRGDDLLYRFLDENRHVSESLGYGFVEIEDIVWQWFEDHDMEPDFNYDPQQHANMLLAHEPSLDSTQEKVNADLERIKNELLHAVPELGSLNLDLFGLFAAHQHSNVLQEQGGRKREREKDDEKENAERSSKRLKTEEKLEQEPVSEKPACY